ncbi:MAG: hypothetical protein EPN21_05665 [Methylococcaceae bacterium]|nr:MAG: hypothetical protein EPN21_05665 [Methylococcaceae bacterium]
MKIYYRISNNSNKKNRLPYATKEHCLENFLKHFHRPENSILILADNVTEVPLAEFLKAKTCANITLEQTALGNAGSFRHLLAKACDEIRDEEFVYFAEDDYLYTDNAYPILLEGLHIANYATLYDHPDKYVESHLGGNPMICGGGEVTRLVITNSSHWKLTNSTTGTFGTNGKIIREDRDVWLAYSDKTPVFDYHGFCELIQNKNRTLISSVPGRATHCDLPWISPLTDWSTV